MLGYTFIKPLFLAVLIGLPLHSFATFKANLTKNQCLNDKGKEGRNPSYVGPCGDLTGANLSKTYLSGRKFDFANLSGANLFRSDLRHTSLIKANLSHADLSKSDLRGANLKGANLNGAVLSRAVFDEKTILPITNREALTRGMLFHSQKKLKPQLIKDAVKSSLGGIKKN